MNKHRGAESAEIYKYVVMSEELFDLIVSKLPESAGVGPLEKTHVDGLNLQSVQESSWAIADIKARKPIVWTDELFEEILNGAGESAE